ncbi:Fic family protein [Paludibaculum fermentans]|uniref:Fic family protein n=1 Tax=Paludibaculum fermentans TaxID=1473598 RepID=UPI003EBDD79D
MPTPSEKLASSLTVLRTIQESGRRVFLSSEFGRTDRERLLKSGFLAEVIKGWLISSSPNARDGDSTPWYASFWEFCSRYCDKRFGSDWHLSPEQSLFLHAERTVVPSQVVVYSPLGKNNKMDLPNGTSLFDLKVEGMPPARDLVERDGLRLFSAAASLVRVPERLYMRHPVEARIVLAGLREASEVLEPLLEGGQSFVAGRLAGAFRRIGRPAIAGEIVATMKSAGYDVRENDPFAEEHVVVPLTAAAPIAGRLQVLWELMRGRVAALMPQLPGLPGDGWAYLRFVDESYRDDAYHSLSIEGYRVTPDLIERVRTRGWNPEHDVGDHQSRDALSARGYWQAFQMVKEDVTRIIDGADAAKLVRASHRTWYRELFQPCVLAGLFPPGALAGYRNDAVYLRTSRYVPPRWEAVRDAMPVLFQLLAAEESAFVRAVLGHWMFGYIHPFPDGNGRMARFLMNAMLASGGYPWTVIRVDDRDSYLSALDRASIDMDIEPFAALIARRVNDAMERTATAYRRRT